MIFGQKETNSLQDYNSIYILLTEIMVVDIHSLEKVCVWNMQFPPDGVEVDTTGSPNVYFTTDCSK